MCFSGPDKEHAVNAASEPLNLQAGYYEITHDFTLAVIDAHAYMHQNTMEKMLDYFGKDSRRLLDFDNKTKRNQDPFHLLKNDCCFTDKSINSKNKASRKRRLIWAAIADFAKKYPHLNLNSAPAPDSSH